MLKTSPYAQEKQPVSWQDTLDNTPRVFLHSLCSEYLFSSFVPNMPRRRKPPRAGALTELQPLKIATQIAILQGLYYVVAATLMLFTALVAGVPFSLTMVLGWEGVRGDTTQGWLLSFVWLIDGGFCMYVGSSISSFSLSLSLSLCVFPLLKQSG